MKSPKDGKRYNTDVANTEQGCDDPRRHGKGLTANRSGEWRYRIGDYRLLAEIQDGRLIILMLTVGHRSDVYK